MMFLGFFDGDGAGTGRGGPCGGWITVGSL
jgi:hypothetical protein